MTDSSKVVASSIGGENDEDEKRGPNVRGFRHNHANSSSPRRKKGSGPSSDDETSSSSLLPIPDTLRQMRGELKRITNHAENLGEDSSGCPTRVPGEEMTNSLQELRRKYSIKNEASVTMKMNSANIMLDDILNGNNYSNMSGGSVDPNFQPSIFRESILEARKIGQESDTFSLAESVSTGKHWDHPPKIIGRTLPVIPSDLGHRHCCKIHEKVYRPTCTCSSGLFEKGLRAAGSDSEDKQRKMSFLDKIQNLHLRYKIQSVYKIVQKNNPFNNKNRRDDSSLTEQGIPRSNYHENPVRRGQKCEEKRCAINHYPRRMVFDLVESSDASQSEEKSVEEDCRCSVEIKCTCQRPRECTCPELMSARCTCGDPPKSSTPEPDRCSLVCDQLPNYQSSSVKVDEFVQTDSHRGSIRTARQEIKVEYSNGSSRIPAAAVPKIELGNHPAFQPTGKATTRATGPKTPFSSKELKKHMEEEFCPGSKDWKSRCFKERKLIERTDIYYFDHGNSSYYRTTDNHPVRYTECLVERTDEYATKFWGEIFGVIEIGVAFLVSFILQLYRFFFTSIIRSLTVGLVQIFSDYFFKPLLTIIFNGLIQPCLILVYNVATSVRDLCFPVSEIFGFYMKEISNLLKSCRLVDVNHSDKKLPACECGNKG